MVVSSLHQLQGMTSWLLPFVAGGQGSVSRLVGGGGQGHWWWIICRLAGVSAQGVDTGVGVGVSTQDMVGVSAQFDVRRVRSQRSRRITRS